MAELEEYLRKGKNCTLTESMIQKILELVSGTIAEEEYERGLYNGRENGYWEGYDSGRESCSS